MTYLKWNLILWQSRDVPTHAGPIGCIMLVLLPHKYKVGHIDLILIKHHNLLKPPEIPKFSYVPQTFHVKLGVVSILCK